MQLINTDDINNTYNFAILSNKTVELMNKQYHLSARIMTEDDTISGMGYQILDILDIKLENVIKKINKLKENIDSKELTYSIFYELFENSNIYAIQKEEIESIINKLNKTSYTFYTSNTFIDFLNYNELKFYIIRDNLLRIIDNKESNTNEIIIDLYNKLKNKNYKYLDGFIEYVKQRKNQLIKRK